VRKLTNKTKKVRIFKVNVINASLKNKIMKFRDKLTEGHYYTEILIILMCIFLFAASCKAQSKEEVYKELIRQEVKHPDIVLAQIRLESGNMTSKLYKANRNFAGMKLAKTRKTTAKGERYGHAYYLHWKDCVKDLKIWQDCYYKGGCYYDFLETIGYAESEEYINKLKQF